MNKEEPICEQCGSDLVPGVGESYKPCKTCIKSLSMSKERVEVLEQVLKRAIKAIRQNCFIIPKDGDKRDRAIGVLDNMKEVLGLKGSEGGEEEE